MKINSQIITGTAVPEGYAHVVSIWEMKDIIQMIEAVANDLKIEEAKNLELSFFQRETGKEIFVAVKYINREPDEGLTAIAAEIGEEVTNRRAIAVVDEVEREKNMSLQASIEGGQGPHPEQR